MPINLLFLSWKLIVFKSFKNKLDSLIFDFFFQIIKIDGSLVIKHFKNKN
jgi:hypothetical protein